tara:strand:+ start:936 stop:1853 length:918 start_codon:yes stop_codon:yes gene_type:complete
MIDQITAIEQKRNDNENVDEPRKNDWKGFAQGCVSNALLTTFVALIGVNFIYFTSLESKSQSVFFPSQLEEYFQNGSQKQVGGSAQCRDRPSIVLGNLGNTLKKMGVPPSSGWPYSMKSGDTIDLTVQGVKNWISLSVADYYSNGRQSMKKILNFFSNDNKNLFSTDFVQILFANIIGQLFILFIPVIIFVLFATSFLSSCVRAWNDSDILFLAFVFFLGPAFILSSGLSLIIPLQFLFTFLFIPLFANHNMVLKILSCNIEIFSLFFVILCASSASKSELDNGFILGLYAGILYMIYKMFAKSK